MDRTHRHPAGRRAPSPATPPTYIAQLHKAGAHKGAVGPFASEADATRWASDALDGSDWTFTIEPVIAPIALPLGTAPRRRHLALVR